MDMEAFHAIRGRLEASKTAGWLSEYLVAWHGSGGDLKPAVTVWSPRGLSHDAVRRYVSRALVGLVAAGSIYVAHG